MHSGERVNKGDQLTEGPLNPHDILRLRSRADLQRYIVSEVQRVYRMVGVAVNDKHIEIIIRQMLRHDAIDTPGETTMLPGTLVDRSTLAETNAQVAETGGRVADSHAVLLGVTKASLNNESFLAAASFQDTTRVLTEAVVEGKTDRLHGLKENVIIGKLIPAGTGWDRYHGPALEAPGQSDVLIDTEAMHMAEGVSLDDLRERRTGPTPPRISRTAQRPGCWRLAHHRWTPPRVICWQVSRRPQPASMTISLISCALRTRSASRNRRLSAGTPHRKATVLTVEMAGDRLMTTVTGPVPSRLFFVKVP